MSAGCGETASPAFESGPLAGDVVADEGCSDGEAGPEGAMTVLPADMWLSAWASCRVGLRAASSEIPAAGVARGEAGAVPDGESDGGCCGGGGGDGVDHGNGRAIPLGEAC